MSSLHDVYLIPGQNLVQQIKSFLASDEDNSSVINAGKDGSIGDKHQYRLGLTPLQVYYFKNNHSAFNSLMQKLKDEGFICKFDFESNRVVIRPRGEQSEDNAQQMIRESIIEISFPADNEMKETDDVVPLGPDEQKVLIVKMGNLVKLVGMDMYMAKIREALLASMDKIGAAALTTTQNMNGKDEQIKVETIQVPENKFPYLCTWTELTKLVRQWPAVKLSTGDNCIYLKGPGSDVDKAVTRITDEIQQMTISKIQLGPEMNEAVVDEVAEIIGIKYKCSIALKKGYAGAQVPSPVQVDPQFQSLASLSVYDLKETRVKVVVNALEKQKAHVIVNTTNTELDLGRGRGVSWCILQAAGQDIQTEVKKMYPDGIKLGEVAESSPGNIKTCRTIYHGALPQFPKKGSKDYQKQEDECFRLMVSLVFDCLINASCSEKRYINIAFPALGTGNLEYPPEHVVQLMYTAFRLFKDKEESEKIKEIIIVIYPETTLEVKQMFLAHRQTYRLKTRHVATIEQMREENTEAESHSMQNYEFRVDVGRSLLQIVHGNIHEACEVSDVVLMLWSDQEIDNPDSNNVLKCIDSHKEDWDCSSYVSELEAMKCVEDTTNLSRRPLIHSYCKNYSDKDITNAIDMGLKKAVDLKCSTITIPIVKGGHLAKKPRNSVQMIINAVSKAKTNICVVTVVVESRGTFENVAAKVAEHFKNKFHIPVSIDKSQVADEVWGNTHSELAAASFEYCKSKMAMTNKDSVLVITSDSENKNKQAEREFKERLASKLSVQLQEGPVET